MDGQGVNPPDQLSILGLVVDRLAACVVDLEQGSLGISARWFIVALFC